MSSTQWKLIDTLQKKIRVTRVDAKARHVDGIDLEAKAPVHLTADAKIDLAKIKRAKIYQATLKVYETEFTVELEQQVFESALGDPNRLRALQAMKAAGVKPTKYELIAIKH